MKGSRDQTDWGTWCARLKDEGWRAWKDDEEAGDGKWHQSGLPPRRDSLRQISAGSRRHAGDAGPTLQRSDAGRPAVLVERSPNAGVDAFLFTWKALAGTAVWQTGYRFAAEIVGHGPGLRRR